MARLLAPVATRRRGEPDEAGFSHSSLATGLDEAIATVVGEEWEGTAVLPYGTATNSPLRP